MRIEHWDFLPAPYAEFGKMGRAVYTGRPLKFRGWIVQSETWTFVAVNRRTITADSFSALKGKIK